MSVSTQRAASTTTGSVVTTSDAVSTVPSRRHGRVLAGIVGGLAVATTAFVVLATLPHPEPAAQPDDLSAYAVGGSIYREQVPVLPTPWTSAYGIDTSVYRQQVPSTGSAADLSAYEPGGSVYGQQVPVTARRSAVDGFGSGGATYREQVPSASEALAR
jgi:hypothetical protein